jgi:hypothetical protein
MNGYQKKRILALQDEEELTEWEQGFIDSLANHEEDYTLSPKQNTILNRIAERYRL